MNINPIAFLGILDGITNSLRDLCSELTEICFGLFLKLATFGDIINKSYGIMPTYTKDASTGAFVLTDGAISPLIRLSASFGGALALIFLFVGMIDIYTQEKMSIETFIKPFIQYLLSAVILMNSEKLIALFWNIGVVFQEAVMSNSYLIDDADFALQFPEGSSFGFVAGVFFASLLLMVFSLLLGIIVRICAYIANFSRVVEAGVRGVGFPIAVGISADSSLRQGAIRYLKKFLAVALQGGIFCVISILFTTTSITTINEMTQTLATATGNNSEIFAEQTEKTVSELFNKDTGKIVGEVVSDVGEVIALVKSATPIVLHVESAMSFMLMILSCIVPLFGLALGCIVVLFKSGQICNDIVGA